MQRYTAGMHGTVTDLTPAAAVARVRDGSLMIVDVRPPPERAFAVIALPYSTLENGGLEQLLALPRERALAFLCHHGVRSAQAADYFRAHGFAEVCNIVGGIDAWSRDADPAVPRY